MKRSHHSRRPKINPFQSYREPNLNVDAQPFEDEQVLNAINSLERMPLPQQLIRNRAKSLKQKKTIGINLNMGANHSFMDLGKEMKSKRSLIDENNSLKRKLQSLGNMKVSKRQLTTKKFSAEFEKQLYWNGSANYMISGVKCQYQRIKESYQKKCDDYEELLKSVAVSTTMEFMTYIQALEYENHILARKLQTKKKALQDKSYKELQDITNKVLSDYRQKFDLKLQRQKQKLKATRKENKQLKSKILFLQKLLIEKDNNQHESKRNARKSESHKVQLQNKCNNLELSIKKIKTQNDKAIDSLKLKFAQEIAHEIQNRINFQKQQQEYISRLQKENKYLNSLVQSWKEQKIAKKDSKKDNFGSKQKIEKMDKIHSMVVQLSNENIEQMTHTVQQLKRPLTPYVQSQKDESQTERLGRQSLRTAPYNADKKNSQNSVKNRRVKLHQIEQSIQYARCVLIGKGLNLDWLLLQFSKEQDEWSKQYINMKQARQICEKHLQLSRNQSHMIARYLIQDSSQEHVYTDDINEHSRIIVKSIVKNIFGNYSVFQEEKDQFEKTLSEWQSKLQWTLENTTKGGVVSKEKFKDLMQSLSLNSPGFVLYCLSKMALHSQSLQRLRFSQLFCQINKK